MKRIILSIIAAVVAVGAVEITVLGGVNRPIWYRQMFGPDSGFYRCSLDGISTQAGILLGFDLVNRKGSFPLRAGIETGFNYKYAHYRQYFIYRGGAIPPMTPPAWDFRYEEIPMLARLNLELTQNMRLGAAAGPVIVNTLDGSWSWGDYENVRVPGDMLGTTVGVQAKLDAAFRLSPLLWLKPEFSVQYSPRHDGLYKPDPSFTISSYPSNGPEEIELSGRELTFYLSLGLALKI